jgi:1,4-alpha-glucan branching enzyme
VPLGDGTTEFRVWAPNAREVAVRSRGETHALAPETDGLHSARLRAPAGCDYV